MAPTNESSPPEKRQTESGLMSGGDRVLAEALQGFLTRGPNVSHVRTRGTEGAGSAAVGEELPPVAHSPCFSKARNPGSPCHVSGDAADAGDRHAAARNTEGRSGDVAARKHQDDGRRLRSDHRTERCRCRKLAHLSGAGQLEDTRCGFGPEGEKLQRSECDLAKFGEAGWRGSCKLLKDWLLR